MIDEDAIRRRWEDSGSKLDERGRRLFAAGAVRAAGWGGSAEFDARSRKFEQGRKSVSGRARLTCERAGEPAGRSRMTPRHPLVFLVDVDNTLIDNDGIQHDLKDHLERVYGFAARVRYWRILEDLFQEVGYRDYLGALQRYRLEHPLEVELLSMSSFLVEYPFADRLFPGALAVLKRLGGFAPTAILSDGDVVFQPRKVERAGLSDAVAGRVLIYVHKEEALDDVASRYPADHYVLVDDKLRILTTVKQSWGERVTTVFVRQGSYAHDPKAIGALPRADVTIEHIADLLCCDLRRLDMVPPRADSRLEATR
jgi:FMN phosphatase YigB (HAD superfamily)